MKYLKTPIVDLRDMKYKEGLNGGMNVNEGAELEKESKSVC